MVRSPADSFTVSLSKYECTDRRVRNEAADCSSIGSPLYATCSMLIRSVRSTYGMLFHHRIILVALQSRRRFLPDCDIAAFISRIIISVERAVVVVVVAVVHGTLPVMTTPSTIFCLSRHLRRRRGRHRVIVIRLRHKSLLCVKSTPNCGRNDVNTFGPLASTAVA